jgi:hypothetical protein
MSFQSTELRTKHELVPFDLLSRLVGCCLFGNG